MFLVIIFAGLMFFTGCGGVNNSTQYTRFSYMSMEVFDTFTHIQGYADSQEEFEYFSDIILTELRRLHRLFDRFNEYDGIANIYTINKNAGIQPVEVDPDVIKMLKIAVETYHKTGGVVNITIGAVTNLWREGTPDIDELTAAGRLININDLVIDAENRTVFLRYQGVILDSGSIAKGFAIEQAAQKAIDAGFESFALTVGGDTFLANAPLSGSRGLWGVGVLDPLNPGEIIDSIFAANTTVFTSGDYLRPFHIIDPRTLHPASSVRSVTVVHPNAVIAENLSLAAFILDINEAKELLAEFHAQALWVMADGMVIYTEGW